LQGSQERQLYELPNEEKEKLTRMLKLKWQQINMDYLKLPFALDTPTKKKRKEMYEAQLQQIEQDIRLLDCNDKVMVEKD
jgi:hypothetical protein